MNEAVESTPVANILIIDDNKENLFVLSKVLTLNGYNVRTLSDSTSALDEVRAEAPDLILLDVRMPGVDGYEICARLKDDAQTRDIPVIFISVATHALDKVKAFSAGGVDYLTKPFQMDELLVRVKTHLALRGMQKQLEEKNAQLEASSEHLEEMVAERTAELQVQYARLEAILRSVGDAILVSDVERKIQYVNHAFTALTGYEAEEILGHPAHAVGVLLGDAEQASLRQALSEGGIWQGEAVGRRKDGRVYDAALTVAPVWDVEGHLMGFVSSHHDISQSKALEHARNQFIANVSHQFRTPVTTLQLYAHLLGKTDLPENSRDYLQKMRQELDRLTHLIQDVLHVNQLDSGNIITTWEAISPLSLVEALYDQYAHQAESAGITLTMSLASPEYPPIKGDIMNLRQALEEIMNNALTFTPSGGQVTIRAEVLEEADCSWFVVAIYDTGPGILPDERDILFERFFRGSLAESGHVPGTGLGLSIAQMIIQAHGGRITVELSLIHISEPTRPY